MGKAEQEKRNHDIMWHGFQYPYPRICRALQTVPACRADNGDNGNGGLFAANRSSSVQDIFRIVHEHLSNGTLSISRSSSSSSLASSVTCPIPCSVPCPVQVVELEHVLQGTPPLKHLDFVRSQGGMWLTWMTSAYTSGRSFVPLPSALINCFEDHLLQPILEAVSNRSGKALFALDSTVDNVVTGIVDGLPGVILKVANLPPVSAAVRIATPTAEAINDRYQAAHDAVVSTELYLRVSEGTLSTLRRVHDSRLYKGLVQPFTEPAVNRIMASETYQAVKEHLTPRAARDSQLDTLSE